MSLKSFWTFQVLAESGISYDAPLNPIQVAANRAERIQKEKQKSAQETAAQLNQQRIAAAQQAANAAQQSAAATARVAIGKWKFVTVRSGGSNKVVVEINLKNKQQDNKKEENEKNKLSWRKGKSWK